MRNKILAFVMAGGKGTRLEPLTSDRSKPAVPFGGKYRIIDFVLSNLVNSGIYSIYVLTQFKSQSLSQHLDSTWNFGSMLTNHFIIPVPAQQRTGEHWYQGTADAIYQNFNLISDQQPELVAVFGGDHIFKMNVEDLIAFHQEQSDVTIAAIPVPIAEANQFGVIQVDANWRITGFQEKPKNPTPIPDRPDVALVSMGNYLFNRSVLTEALAADAIDPKSSHDFGKNVLPALLAQGKRLFAYDYNRNRIPGSTNQFNDAYWRDVGTLESYYEASMDLRAISPQLDLYNQEWPIRSEPNNFPPAKFVHNAEGRVGQAIQSIVCEGTIISGSTVIDSVIGRRCRINSYSEVHSCVLMDDVEIGRGARVRRCIIDKHVRIPNNDVVGYNRDEDAKRFHVTESGIVVIAKHQRIELPKR
ncbi:MAG: glucose-1-phosphate adenylyltransferase [Planctomycetes bacterium]|nr:glucose-1-phosphate adenylyltransferase [Planctomycetota bacterium]